MLPDVERSTGLPGVCDMDRVRLCNVSSCSKVRVTDRLQVPPGSMAVSAALPKSPFFPSWTRLRLIVLPSGAAALPPTATEFDDWLGVVEAAPSPSDEAEVSPAAALPAEPTVPLALPGAVEPAPEATVEADAPPGAGPALPPAAHVPVPLTAANAMIETNANRRTDITHLLVHNKSPQTNDQVMQIYPPTNSNAISVFRDCRKGKAGILSLAGDANFTLMRALLRGCRVSVGTARFIDAARDVTSGEIGCSVSSQKA